MNRHIIYTTIGLLFICSCASINNKDKVLSSKPDIVINDSIKDKYEALNDYFDDELKDKSDTIMIMKEKLSINVTLNILKTNDIWAVDSTGMGRLDKRFYKEEDWQKLREENGNSSLEKIEHCELEKGECCWTAIDFRYKKIIFEDLEIGKKDFEKKYFSSPNYYIYWFSEPVYYKNKEYVIFTRHKGTLAGGYPTRLIIMKKIKNKWVHVYSAHPSWQS